MTAEPRTVTLEQINAEIASEHCFTAREGCEGACGGGGTYPEALGLLTFCVLVLRNGHEVVGVNHGAIDATTHSAELGREDARQDACKKVRDYLGFRLRDQIAAEQGAAPAAKRYTAADIADLKWAMDLRSLDDKVNVWARMKDEKEFRTSAIPPRHGEFSDRDPRVFAARVVLAVANGETP